MSTVKKSDQVLAIALRMLSSGATFEEVSAMTGVGKSTLYAVLKSLRDHGSPRPPARPEGVGAAGGGMQGPGSKSLGPAGVAWLCNHVDENNAVNLPLLREILWENHGVRAAPSTLCVCSTTLVSRTRRQARPATCPSATLAHILSSCGLSPISSCSSWTPRAARTPRQPSLRSSAG